MTMNCHACGAPETAEDRFCPNCGAVNTEARVFREERGAVTAEHVEAGSPALTDEDMRRANMRGGQVAAFSDSLKAQYPPGAGLQVPSAYPGADPNALTPPPGHAEVLQARREAPLVGVDHGEVVDPGAAREAQHMPPTAAPVYAKPAVETVQNQAPHPVRLGTVANNAEAPPVAGEPANDQGAPLQPVGSRPDRDVPPVTEERQEEQRAAAAKEDAKVGDDGQTRAGVNQDQGAATPRTPTPIAPAPGAPLVTAP